MDIHKLFMGPISRVLWQVLTGRPISKEKSEYLTKIIKLGFKTLERPDNFMSLIEVTVKKTRFVTMTYRRLIGNILPGITSNM